MITCEGPWAYMIDVGRSKSREIVAPDAGLGCQDQLETILHSRPDHEGDDENDEMADHKMGLVKSKKQKDNWPNTEVVSGVGVLVSGHNHALWYLILLCQRYWGVYSCFRIKRAKGISIGVDW